MVKEMLQADGITHSSLIDQLKSRAVRCRSDVEDAPYGLDYTGGETAFV